ncbi:hypothetical protein ERJ75_001502600 [Trypanosoma vivax]|nr:hypothetical protein ERJ75_001502600 [Trypanosoma vivax]
MDLPAGRSNQQTLERAKSVRDANGMLAAEDGILKAGRVQTAAETRGLSAQRAEPTPSCRGSARGRFFTRPQPANSGRKITTLWWGMLGFAECRCCGANSATRPSNLKKRFARTKARSTNWRRPRPNTHAQRAAACFQCPQSPAFCCKTRGMQRRRVGGTVGEMGRAEGPQRIGARALNRRRPLRAKSARPRMKAESPGGAPKGPRREEGPHHQARRQVRRNNRRLHRATRDAFARGEWGTTVRRAMRRWLASLVGSQKARSSPGNNELRGRYGIGFRRRGKKTTLQSGPAGCTARGQERGSQQQREQQRAASASKRQRWETQRQHPNRRRRTQTTLASQKRRTAIRASHLWRRERAELPFQGEPFLSALLPADRAGAAARSLSSQSRRAAAERGSDLQEQNGRAGSQASMAAPLCLESAAASVYLPKPRAKPIGKKNCARLVPSHPFAKQSRK